MKRSADHPIPWLIAGAAFTLGMAGIFVVTRPAPTVLTTGPCSMLGLAELAEHPGQPFLVIDCEGFQFGVPAVLP